MKKLLALVLIFVLMLGVTACGGKKEAESPVTDALLAAPEIVKDYDVKADFKLGVILLHDENSTYDLNFINAVMAVKKALGLSDDQVIMKRNIPESNDCYEAAKDLAVKGCKIIFADSFGHETYMLQAAKEYPDVQFCHATGTMAHTEKLANFHNAFASIYEGRYLAGVAAGMKLNEIKAAGKLKGATPLIGYVGAFTYAEVISGYTSFYLGAKSVCPDVTMKVQFTGSWYDENEEKSAAQALIAAKCDLISQHADSLGAPTACEDAGIPNVSYNGSTFEAGENTFLISSAINWAPYFNYIIKCVNTGVAIDADWTGTIATGSVVLSGLNTNVAAEGTEAAIKKAIDELKAGTLKVFDTSKDNFILKDGAKVTTYLADVDTDAAFTPDTEVVVNGFFNESSFRSAPYFDMQIDGIELVNSKF
ncbi:MAG: BMP family ABC transporter substrate-binding protein [Clostridia bacterium]|nr:BMP family ABC transporter substrate-binding protein [Clostridia bacterium]